MRDNKTMMPKHALEAVFHLCMDSRKEKCKCCNTIKVETEMVSFSQCFCGYAFIKKEYKPPCMEA